MPVKGNTCISCFMQHNVQNFECSLCFITYRRCVNIYTEYAGFGPKDDPSSACLFPPDITFYVDGKPVEAHRIILCARSPFFEKKFKTDWKDRKEVRFSNQKLYYGALYSLIHFFYSDRLEVAVDDMENLARACKVCKCEELQKILDNEVAHQKYAEYKSARELDLDNSQKRFILQAQSLPEEDRLPSALQRILQTCLANSREEGYDTEESNEMPKNLEDLADLYIKVGDKVFHCNQVILASRSEYFRARLARTVDFLEGNCGFQAAQNLLLLEEHDLSAEAFEKMLEYMYDLIIVCMLHHYFCCYCYFLAYLILCYF